MDASQNLQNVARNLLSRSGGGRPPAVGSPAQGGGLDGGEWRNWSGSVRFRPARVERPASEEDLARLVRRAQRAGRSVRVVGAGHSSSELVETRETLVSLERMQGLVSHDTGSRLATIQAGMSVHDASVALREVGLMMHNWGDVDVQTVVGAIATGTHGSGLKQPNLAWMLVGGRLVDGNGDIVEFDDTGPLIHALRCGLGATGIITAAKLRLQPAFRLERQEWCLRTMDCMRQLDALAEAAELCDFYWYPRSDLVKLRLGGAPGSLPAVADATLEKKEEGWGNQVVPKDRQLRFEEMEYLLPARAALSVFQEVRRRVLEVHRKTVGWRVLWRYVAPDDAYLSEAHGRETIAISLHQNVGLPYWDYFREIEAVFRAHGGRPHWGKKHSLEAKELRPLYPRWDAYLRERERMDPAGTFLSPYLERLLGVSR